MYWFGIFLLPVFLWVIYYLMTPPTGLRILAYHKLSATNQDNLTVSAHQLNEQLATIERLDFTPIWFADLQRFLNGQILLPNNPLILTFDDEHEDVYRIAYPLLKKYRFKANLFLSAKGIEDIRDQPGLSEYKMVAQMARDTMGLGLLLGRESSSDSSAQVEMDLMKSIALLEQEQCPFGQVVAFPYEWNKSDCQETSGKIAVTLKRLSIDYAVRCSGSGMNFFPLRNLFDLRRITINGTDSLRRFKRKLKGKRVLSLNQSLHIRSSTRKSASDRPISKERAELLKQS